MISFTSKFPKHLLLGITTKANNAMNEAIQTVKPNTVKKAFRPLPKLPTDTYSAINKTQDAKRFNPMGEFFEGISRLLG